MASYVRGAPRRLAFCFSNTCNDGTTEKKLAMMPSEVDKSDLGMYDSHLNMLNSAQGKKRR